MSRCRRLASAAIAVGTLLVAAAGAARANGLLTSEDPATGRPASAIRLRAHRVKATVRDRVAEVVVEQVFRSDATVPLEATYVFPLPDGVAVHRFEMQVGGQ